MITYTVKVYDNGATEWLLDGKRHRTDGPAVEYASGGKYWYLDGKRHRTDGPAIEYASGSKYWFLDGKRHRTDGPAIEYADGTKLWFLDDKQLTESQWKKAVKPKVTGCVGKVVEVDGVKYRLIAA